MRARNTNCDGKASSQTYSNSYWKKSNNFSINVSTYKPCPSPVVGLLLTAMHFSVGSTPCGLQFGLAAAARLTSSAAALALQLRVASSALALTPCQSCFPSFTLCLLSLAPRHLSSHSILHRFHFQVTPKNGSNLRLAHRYFFCPVVLHRLCRFLGPHVHILWCLTIFFLELLSTPFIQTTSQTGRQLN